MICNHTTPHLLAWNNRWAGTDVRFVEAIRTALAHATEDDLDAGDLDVMETLIERTDRLDPRNSTDTRAYAIEVDDAELAAAQRVLESACLYMHDNGYAADSDFPEDRQAAQILGATGGPALICWTEAFDRERC